MPRRSELDGAPRDWLVSGDWPDGEFRADTPEPVAWAVAISRALLEALQDRNKSHVAAQARIPRSALYRLCEGSSWPDTLSIAKLELELDTSLWPKDRPMLRRQSAPEP